LQDDDGGCTQYSATGEIVVTPHTTHCSVADKIHRAMEGKSFIYNAKWKN